MRTLEYEDSFLKDLKRMAKKHYPLDKLKEIKDNLLMFGDLFGRYHDHALAGDWAGFRELHIERNMLLIYRRTDDEIFFVRLGSHDDLFD